VRRKARFRGYQSLVVSCSIFDVGLDEELAPDLEKTRHLRDEFIAYHKAFLVPLFPPRVWEVDENPHDRPLRLEPPQGERGVLGEDARPGPQTSGTEPRVHHTGPFAAHFETQEPDTSLDLGALDEKPTSAGPHLELEPLAGDESSQVDAIAIGKARGVFVRSRHSHWRARRA